MRVFEILILATLFVRLVGYSFPAIRRTRWIDYLPGITILLVVIHLALENYRLQMVPAYGLALILFVLSIRKLQQGGQSQAKKPSTRVVSSLGFLLRLSIFTVIAILPIIIPVFHLPEPTGEFQIGTTNLYLVDSTRPEIFSTNQDDHREMMVRVWYPAQLNAGDKLAPLMENPPFPYTRLSLVKTHAYSDAPVSNVQSEYPVLIFSHGHVGFPEQNLTLMEELASHGYIVCSMTHPYQTILTTFPDGRTVAVDATIANDFLLGRSLPASIYAEHLRVWTEDTRFLLDELEMIKSGEKQSALIGKLDLSHIGIFGQSFGGVTAVNVCMLDDRCQAGVSLDSGLPGDYTGNSQNPPLNQPFLFMFNEFAGYHRSGVLARLKNTAYVVVVQGTKHLDYTDLPLYSPALKFTQIFGPINRDRMVKIVNAYTMAFWDETLKGEISSLLDAPSADYPEVKIDVPKP